MVDIDTEYQALIPRNSFKQYDTLIIIPAYNEEECIEQVVNSIKNTVPCADILVINDGSIDATAEMARRNGASVLNLPFNLGIGGAVGAAFILAEEMGYEWVVRLDGDGQHDASDIPRLLAPVQKGRADAVYGSRFLGTMNSYNPPIIRRIGIWLYGLIVSIIIGQRIYDATSGMWCVNRRVIRQFSRYFPQDYPEVESHIVLHKAGLAQMEVPVSMHARIGGQSTINAPLSIYYAFKVLLSVLVRAIQDTPGLAGEDTNVIENSNNFHNN